MINNDIGIITNNELKKNISRLYDYFVTGVTEVENRQQEYNTYSSKRKYFLKYFKLEHQAKDLIFNGKNKREFNVSVDRNELFLSKIELAKNDDAFKIILSESLFFRKLKVQLYEELKKRITALNRAINAELEQLGI